MLEILPHPPSHFAIFFVKKAAVNLKKTVTFFKFTAAFSH